MATVMNNGVQCRFGNKSVGFIRCRSVDLVDDERDSAGVKCYLCDLLASEFSGRANPETIALDPFSRGVPDNEPDVRGVV
jgi:hypothetical protein